MHSRQIWAMSWNYEGSTSCAVDKEFDKFFKGKGIDVGNAMTDFANSGISIGSNVLGTVNTGIGFARYAIPITITLVVGLGLFVGVRYALKIRPADPDKTMEVLGKASPLIAKALMMK